MTKSPDAIDQPVTDAWIGIGANLGEARNTVELAIDALGALPKTHVLKRSSLWHSKPIDAEGPDFINAVVKLQTRLEPLALLDHLQAIEQHFGRERPFRHAPRTLDLDMLTYGDLTLEGERLVLPHPRIGQRAFVLAPLLEVEPELRIPGLPGLALLLEALSDQVVERR